MLRSVYAHAVRILLSLYCAEAALFLILVGVYKASVYDWTLLSTKGGATLTGGAIGLIGSGWLLVRQLEASGSLRRRAFALGLTTNLVAGLILVLLAETVVRIVARRAGDSIVVGSVALRPTWSELVAKSRGVLAGVDPWGTWATSYFVFDRELGWTVGPNRRSPNGLYFSSVEGIRSSAPDMRMADQAARFRLALIGDSNAFSFEVPFEESWGYHLQRLLGGDVQVLNFGVDGYGVDQMYLRYLRDVRPWKPQVVVVGFGWHDLWRTMSVYPFVSFGWPGYLVKPRFTVETGDLRVINLPLPTPDEVLGAGRVQQLPFVDYDFGYGTTDWRWRFDHGPLVLRFLTSAFPRWPTANPRVSDEATKVLNSRIFAQLAGAVDESGAVLLVVSTSARNALTQETLARAHIPFLEATDCLTHVPADQRRVPSGNHYTGPANLAIAQCTALAVEVALEKAGRRARRTISSPLSSETVSGGGPTGSPGNQRIGGPTVSPVGGKFVTSGVNRR